MFTKRVLRYVAAFGLALAMWPAFSQESPAGNYTKGWRVDVMPGMYGEFMQALEEHIQWRRDNGETWTWIAYRPVTGEHINSIYVRSPEHTLADMDAYQEFEGKAGEHWDGTVDQYVESVASWISRADEEISSWPEDLRPSLIQVFVYNVKPGHHQQFNEAMRKIHQALVEVNWSEPYEIEHIVSGGPGYQVTIARPYTDFADMADPEKSLNAALGEGAGEREAGEILEQFSGALDHVEEFLVMVDPEHSIFQEE